MKFAFKVSVQDLNTELLTQWCELELYDKIMSDSLESQNQVLHSSSSNKTIFKTLIPTNERILC